MPNKVEKKNNQPIPLFFSIESDSIKTSEAPSEIHILPVGKWNHPTYGKMEITADDIDQFIQHFDQGLRKGIPITEGHEVADEKPAVGWFKKLINKGAEGLYAVVEWTDHGKQLLSDKAYKYFSPEFYQKYEDPETRKTYDNVLVGGALTNKPYFKELSAVVLSEQIIKQFKENTMPTLQEVIEKESGKLTDEEKAFLVEHQSELTDEQKTKFAGDLKVEQTDEEKKAEKEAADKVEADRVAKEAADKEAADAAAKKDASEVKVNASEFAALKEAADKGKKAFDELEARNIGDSVKAMTFSESNKDGKFLPKSETKLSGFLKQLSADQRKEFAEIVAELPKANLFSEIGNDNSGDKSAKKEVDELTAKLMSENKGLKYSAALKQVFAENIELAKRYNAESEPAK